jgi:hypothetical protein
MCLFLKGSLANKVRPNGDIWNFFKLRGGQPLRKGRDLAEIRQ